MAPKKGKKPKSILVVLDGEGKYVGVFKNEKEIREWAEKESVQEATVLTVSGASQLIWPEDPGPEISPMPLSDVKDLV